MGNGNSKATYRAVESENFGGSTGFDGIDKNLCPCENKDGVNGREHEVQGREYGIQGSGY